MKAAGASRAVMPARMATSCWSSRQAIEMACGKVAVSAPPRRLIDISGALMAIRNAAAAATVKARMPWIESRCARPRMASQRVQRA